MAEARPLLRLAACCCAFGLADAAAAADQDMQDAEFLEMLEYLGSWDGTDEEWLILDAAGETAAGSEDDREDETHDDGETAGDLSHNERESDHER